METRAIRPFAHRLRAVPVTILLLVPVVFASIWFAPSPPHKSERTTSPPLTQRLPVEIIPADTPPKWVLVPIDPS